MLNNSVQCFHYDNTVPSDHLQNFQDKMRNVKDNSHHTQDTIITLNSNILSRKVCTARRAKVPLTHLKNKNQHERVITSAKIKTVDSFFYCDKAINGLETVWFHGTRGKHDSSYGASSSQVQKMKLALV